MKDTMMIMMMKSTFYQLRIFNFIIYHFHFNFYLLSNRENEWTKAVKKGYKTASHLLYLPTLWLWCEHVSLALLVFDKWYGTGVFSPAKRTKWFKIFPIFTHFSSVLCLFVIRQKAFLINWMAGWLVSCSFVCQVDTKLECLTKWSDHGVGCYSQNICKKEEKRIQMIGSITASSTFSSVADLIRWLNCSGNDISRAELQHSCQWAFRTPTATPHCELLQFFLCRVLSESQQHHDNINLKTFCWQNMIFFEQILSVWFSAIFFHLYFILFGS